MESALARVPPPLVCARARSARRSGAMAAIEERVAALERAAFGNGGGGALQGFGPQSGAQSGTRGEVALAERCHALDRRMRELEEARPALGALGRAREALQRRAAALRSDELLVTNREVVASMEEQFAQLQALVAAQPGEEDQVLLDAGALAAAREARLNAASLERRAIHAEIAQLLEAYSLWVDAVSQRMVEAVSHIS